MDQKWVIAIFFTYYSNMIWDCTKISMKMLNIVLGTLHNITQLCLPYSLIFYILICNILQMWKLRLARLD